MKKNILVITDNEELLVRFRSLISADVLDVFYAYEFNYAFSLGNRYFQNKYINENWIRSIKVIDEIDSLVSKYEVIFSLHCKQLFPSKLVQNVRCINVHPGLNPFNRGWFPQVFSIINNLPFGATIHEIDADLDHGPVICQKEIKIENWDTSLDAYQKVLDAEIDLLSTHLKLILSGEYQAKFVGDGNLNLKKDFDALCQVDLGSVGTFKEHINKLRALTHGDYLNAYYIDDAGDKIYMKLDLIRRPSEK